MSPTRTLSQTLTFSRELLALQTDEVGRITKKLHVLLEDPTPDAKARKKIRGTDNPLYRLRCGDFRVFYTFDNATVTILSVRPKGDDTYDDLPAMPDRLVAGAPTRKPAQDWQRWTQPVAEEAARTLPHRITPELCTRLGIPDVYHERLATFETENQLYECASVPTDELQKLVDVMEGKPLEQLLGEPRLVVQEADDLLRWREGELLGFLLQLNPEQERFVTWGTGAKGPTLLKGGPGTGKSTVALYRVRTMIDALRAASVERPRVLFTTYTNALVKFSQSLLEQLLGSDAELVDVQTADSWAMRLTTDVSGKRPRMVQSRTLSKLVREALQSASLGDDPLEVASNRRLVERLTPAWFAEEIQTVIEARGIRTVDEYLEAPRAGRGVGLTATQRRFVWRVRELVRSGLKRDRVITWEALRAIAATATGLSDFDAPYDAVVVDEVQDLQPVALRMLVGLCKAPNRLFLTADANQSIYGSSFRWKDVHDDLRFTGRTGTLHRNHRSTEEIGEAARAWLRDGILDEDAPAPAYVHRGPLPAVRAVEHPRDEATLLERFFRHASRDLRLPLNAAAVLTPTNDAAQRLERDLRDRGLTATAMTGRDLDLQAPGIKLLTLQSAKGLEFPMVALAGFPEGDWPPLPDDPEAAEEELARQARTLFVGMTRAMRALLVVVPERTESPLLAEWPGAFWNTGELPPEGR